MAQNYKQWDVEGVLKWLESIHLHHLIPTFERNGISGADLPQLDDNYLRENLRITKPGEIIAIKGAISTLTDQTGQPPPRQANKGNNRKVSNSPRYVQVDRDRSGSFDKQKTSPQTRNPTTGVRYHTVSGGETREPQLKKGASAPDVLDDRCRYSGWIRKQGGGYKNWRRRYLVLRLGCLYYFANETAKEAKGCFTLAGYRTEICTDPEILKKQKWTLKVEPVNGALRTYYMSVGAKRELYAWKQAIDEEIAACARRRRSDDRGLAPSANNVAGEVVEVGEGSSDEEGDEEEPIYDQPDEGDDEFNEDGECPIYDKPDDCEEEEDDDPYTEIKEDMIPAAFQPSTSTLPPHQGKGAALVVNFKGINDWELAPEHRTLGRGGAPTVPMRSPVSLGLDQKQAAQPVRSRDDVGEDTYLPIIGSGPSESSVLTMDRPKISSPIAEEPEPRVVDQDYEDDAELSGEEYGDDSDGGYYIMVRKPEELMPPSCLFDNLDRTEADRLLRAKGVNGTYLIRAGSHAGSEKVLSVWHEDRCRHYKLFKDETSKYSLTHGQTFGTIPELLQYYAQGAHLPRSDFHLKGPFLP